MDSVPVESVELSPAQQHVLVAARRQPTLWRRPWGLPRALSASIWPRSSPAGSSPRVKNEDGRDGRSISTTAPSWANSCLPVSYTHLRAHETGRNLVCRLLLEKKK